MPNSRRMRIYGISKGPDESYDRLVVGVDFNNPKAKNVIGYIRSSHVEEGEETRYPEFWLSLEEMDKLGVLLLLSARFWAKTRVKGDISRPEVNSFKKFWVDLESQWPGLTSFDEFQELESAFDE